MDDAGVFAELYPTLRRFVAAVSSLGVDPDDLVQEAVARTLRRGPLTELDEPATYLRRAIVNLARTQHRDSSRRDRILRTVPPPGSHLDAYPSDFVDLSNLSVDQRAVLFLKYVEHRDTDDIAELLDLSPDAVRARSSRAVRGPPRRAGPNGVVLMNTLDELTTALDAYSERDAPRGADAVFAAASSGPVADHPADPAPRARRPRIVVLAAAAACILVVAMVVLLRSHDEVGVITSPTPDSVPEPSRPPMPALVVPDGEVRDVLGAFDRIWVATDSEPIPGTTRLRSFDRVTGEQRSDLPIAGTVQEVVATDESIFVRLDHASNLPERSDEGRPWTAAVLRIDPDNETVLDTIPLAEQGPIAADSSRVAFSDTGELHLYDDATDAHIQLPIADAVGHDNFERPTPNTGAIFGFTGLAFGPDGLFGKYAKGNELVQMDPATGAHVATQFVEDGAEPIGPSLAVSDGYLWSPGSTTVYGVATPISTPPDLPAERQVVVGGSVSDLAAIDGDRFVALLASQAVVAGDPGREDLRTTLDPAAAGRIVDDDGEPWVAQWNTFVEGPETVVSFVRVRTDAAMPGGSPPATPPAPVLTVMANGPLQDGEVVPIAAAGLPSGAEVTLQVCLVASDTGESCGEGFEPDPVPVVRVGQLAGDGELFTQWTARRSVYDTRWHDCATEACVLRLAGLDATRRPDATTILAETPITFADDGPPIRPTLTVAPVGPVVAGTTVTITGEGFPSGAGGINVTLCPTGRRDDQCYGGAPTAEVADSTGRVSSPFLVTSRGLHHQREDRVLEPPLDCAEPGACSFSVYLDDRSVEPYATVPITVVG